MEEDAGPDLEIEIEDPEAVRIGVDGMMIEIEPDGEDEEGFSDNLAEYLSDSELSTIANDLIGDVEDDVASRKDWIQTYVDGLQLLGLKIEERTEPWEGACGIYHPMLAEALVKFQSETMMSTFPAAGPVKTVIIGKETPAKKASAERVKDDMNYQLTEEMPEYRPEHERMLWGLGLAGNAFKKVYYDPSLERQVSMYVPAEDLVVPYGAASLEAAERVTHIMRKTENELRKLQVAGFYRDIDLGDPDNTLDEVEKKIAEKLGFRATTDSRYKLMEINVNLDLPGFEHKDEESNETTGIALPYIVTVEKGSQEVLSIRRNWNPDDKTFTKRQHFVHYGYIPGFGFYHFGLIHLIGAYAKSGTSIIRQLVDAGSLANLPGGFKTRGLRIKGDDTPIAPGEFRDVDVPSGTMKDNVMTLPYKEPSQVLMALLGQIVEEGRRFANTADMQVSDMSSQAPVGTTLAILERTLKVMSAVQARIHYSLKRELKLLKKIIADYTPEEYDYEPTEGSRRAKKSDYDNVDVIPVSDPNASTMAQKIVQYQAALQLAQTAPQLYNLPLLHRQMLDVLGIKDAQKLVPMDEDQKPTDPISENQNLLKNKPVKAFLAQNHAAHIAVHMSMAQDPKIQALVKNVPQLAQQLEATLMAHVFDHLGMQYRIEIEKQLGMDLPPQHDENGEDINMPPDVEARLAPLLAQAAAQLLQQNSAQAAQQQAQQQAQDPIIQMQMQELQIKAQEQQRKSQRDVADIQLEQQRLGLERERIQMQAQTDIAKTMATTQKEKEQMAIDMMKYQKDKEHDTQKQDKQLLAQGLQQAHQFADAEENRKQQSEASKQKSEKPEVKEKKGK
jgi:hypothetical protein